MRIWLGLQVFPDAIFSFRCINRFETFRKRTCACLLAQRQCLCPLQKRIDCPAQIRPVLDLTRNGAFRNFTDQSSIEHQNIRELYRLTHRPKVAFCHPPATRMASFRFQKPSKSKASAQVLPSSRPSAPSWSLPSETERSLCLTNPTCLMPQASGYPCNQMHPRWCRHDTMCKSQATSPCSVKAYSRMHVSPDRQTGAQPRV